MDLVRLVKGRKKRKMVERGRKGINSRSCISFLYACLDTMNLKEGPVVPCNSIDILYIYEFIILLPRFPTKNNVSTSITKIQEI